MITDAKPWDLAKDENQRETLNAVLYRAAETLRWLSVLLYPVMPDAAREIYKQLGLADDVRGIDPRNLKWGELTEGTAIGEVKPVFPRIDKAKTMEEIKEQTSEVRDQKSERRARRSDVSGAAEAGGPQPGKCATNSEPCRFRPTRDRSRSRARCCSHRHHRLRESRSARG